MPMELFQLAEREGIIIEWWDFEPHGYRVNSDGYLEINESPLPGLEISEADVIRLIYRFIPLR